MRSALGLAALLTAVLVRLSLAAMVPKPPAAVRHWMRPMTLSDEVAQLVFVSFRGQPLHSRSREYQKLQHLIRDAKIGGLILINVSNGRGIQKAEPYALAAFLNRLQRMARVPLMVAGDFERGASMRLEGVTEFPHAMAFGAAGDPELARYEGEITAHEARALGVHWIYAPVADVNSNPANPIINIRSFGEDPQAVAAEVSAFIAGAHEDKRQYVMVTAKHFPGHGDTSIDTHLNLATVTADRARLDAVELVPFRAAIAAGVDAVMTAHVAVPALAPADLPATLSPAILTDLLRQQLQFNGLIVTDALDMGGIVKGFGAGEAAVRALEAGADVLLMPADADLAIRAVVHAVETHRLTRERIRASVVKLLEAKQKLGLDRQRMVNLEAIGDSIDAPEAVERARQIAERAVTLVRNQSNAVPLVAPERACYWTLPEGRYSLEGQTFAQEVRRRLPSARVTTLDASVSAADADSALAKAGDCESYVVAAFSSTGAAGLAGELPRVVAALAASGKPVILVALGNPYLLGAFPAVAAYLATFSTVPFSEAAAVQALWGEIPIGGHLPVTIPGMAALREGIQLPAAHAPASR